MTKRCPYEHGTVCTFDVLKLEDCQQKLKCSPRQYEKDKLHFRQKAARIREVLEEEDAWVHVALLYVNDRLKDGNLHLRKDAAPDTRRGTERLVTRLNLALGDSGYDLVERLKKVK